jgi:integrase
MQDIVTRSDHGTTRTLTDRLIKSLTAPERGQTLYRDGVVPGLYLRVSQGNTKAWLVCYRIKPNPDLIRDTIGKYPDLTLARAREEARNRRADAYRGIDPRPKPQPVVELPTVADLCQEYLDNHAIKKRPSSQRNDKAMIERYVKPALGKLTVAEVIPFNIETLLNKIASPKKGGHKYQANRVRSLLMKMFNRAVQKRQWCVSNPVAGVTKFQEHQRKMYLNPEQAKRMFTVLKDYEDQRVSNALALMFFTGARRGEVLSATWDQFKKIDDRTIWTKPSSHTKQKADHIVPLNQLAVQVLERIKAGSYYDKTYLFPGDCKRQQLKEIKRPWAHIVEAAKIPADRVYGAFRIHDLRHTFASLLINNGESLKTIGGLLGHTNESTTQRYAHLYTDTLSAATDKLSQALPALEFGMSANAK